MYKGTHDPVKKKKGHMMFADIVRNIMTSVINSLTGSSNQSTYHD
jgi:hypothetical protein